MAKITELVRFDWFIKYMFRDKSDFEILEGLLSELLNDSIQILCELRVEIHYCAETMTLKGSNVNSPE